MNIPAVMFIEMAADILKTLDAKQVAREAKEFHELGDGGKNAVKATIATFNLVSEGEDVTMLAGYLLGLETARALLATNVAAVQTHVMV